MECGPRLERLPGLPGRWCLSGIEWWRCLWAYLPGAVDPDDDLCGRQPGHFPVLSVIDARSIICEVLDRERWQPGVLSGRCRVQDDRGDGRSAGGYWERQGQYQFL